MNPAQYTLKSIAGPVLLIVAAYLYGQSVGRREAKAVRR